MIGGLNYERILEHNSAYFYGSRRVARLVSRRERWFAFCALIAFVVIDYITGVMCAISDKKLSSAVGFKGICRKVLIFALVGGGHILDTRVIGAGSVLRTAVIFFYLSNEGISLLENAAHLGLPVPKKLKDVLEQLHKRSEKEDDDED